MWLVALHLSYAVIPLTPSHLCWVRRVWLLGISANVPSLVQKVVDERV